MCFLAFLLFPGGGGHPQPGAPCQPGVVVAAQPTRSPWTSGTFRAVTSGDMQPGSQGCLYTLAKGLCQLPSPMLRPEPQFGGSHLFSLGYFEGDGHNLVWEGPERCQAGFQLQNAGLSIGKHQGGLFAVTEVSRQGSEVPPRWLGRQLDRANLCPVLPDQALTEPQDQLEKKKNEIKSDSRALWLPSPEGRGYWFAAACASGREISSPWDEMSTAGVEYPWLRGVPCLPPS